MKPPNVRKFIPAAMQNRLNALTDACRAALPGPDRSMAVGAGMFLLLFLMFFGLHLLCAKGVSMALTHLNEKGPVSVTLHGVESAAFPPGMLASKCLIHNGKTGALARIGNVTIRPSLTALFSGGFGLSLHGTMAQGSVDAVLRTQSFTNLKTLRLSATVNGVRLKKLLLAQEHFPVLDGVVSGRSVLDTSGNGALDLHAGLLKTTFEFPALSGYPVMGGKLAATFANGVMQVDELRLQSGADFQINVRGTMRPQWSNQPDAVLNLAGTLRAPAERIVPGPMGAKINPGKDTRFTLQGSVAAPKYVFE
jgi:hypothetical protein